MAVVSTLSITTWAEGRKCGCSIEWDCTGGRELGSLEAYKNLMKFLLSNQFRPDPFLTSSNGMEDNLGQLKSLSLLYSTFNYPGHGETQL